MQQILDFTIDIFDVRTKNSIKIKDDRELVRSIQINKDLQLNNQAVISFAKSKSYKLLNIEESIKLYNYVKIELTVQNYETGKNIVEIDKLYFSGFINDVSKVVAYGLTPTAAVNITIVDFANLFKTTFYTKNITFFNILQQAVPEFRLLNFHEVFGKKSNRLLDDFYSVNQIGFVFFSFFFFKFLYSIVYDKPGEQKKIGTENIFKQFKIYMPFGFDLKEKSGEKKFESIFNDQVSSLIIYKKLQGVALDLYKYLYPEPIFEFSTFETSSSVILIIRPTPFMAFDRPRVDKITLSSRQKSGIDRDVEDEDITIEGSINDINTYNVIEQDDFGFNRVAKSAEIYGSTPGQQIREHLSPIINTLNSAMEESKKLDVDTLIPDKDEEQSIINKYFKSISFDIRFLEMINMTRSAQSVVNVVWTTPATDTAVLQTSGRALVMGLLGEKLGKIGGDPNDQYAQYVANQYVTDQTPNPAFFWNYRNANPDKYVSGDINYFGLREFEIKWNCLTIYDSSVYFILNFIDKKLLEEIRKSSNDSDDVKFLSSALESNAQNLDKEKKKNPKAVRNKEAFKTIGVFYEQAFQDRDFRDALKQLANKNWTEEKIRNLKKSDLPAFIKEIKNLSASSFGSFASRINGVISRAYRENEHLYDCQIINPINLSIIPGMIIESEYPNIKDPKFNTLRFKGYVTGTTHTIDFNSATMKSNIRLSRAVSNDSALVVKREN